jgi:hypothetical protein
LVDLVFRFGALANIKVKGVDVVVVAVEPDDERAIGSQA